MRKKGEWEIEKLKREECDKSAVGGVNSLK
jgi:hypothetical protein